MNNWEYSESIESEKIVNIEKKYGNFIDGKFVTPKSKQYIDTISPSTEKILSSISIGNQQDVDYAVASAKEGLKKWSKTNPSERAKYLFKLARLIQERSREFAVLESLDGGKPIKESRDFDLPQVAQNFFYYAGWADKLDIAWGNEQYKPYGVVGQIIPWNFPLLMLSWKVAPALATGNTVVLKPAETTPLTALLFAELCEEVGLPDGVFNLVTGDGSTGSHLVNHKDIKKIAFTGSTGVGKYIQKSLAGKDVGLTLELGGKAANIVYSDAALDEAVEGVVNGIFFNQGHVCCAGSRLLVQEDIEEKFIKKLEKRMQTLNVGNPLDKNTDVGAINSKDQLDKIEKLVNEGVADGGDLFQIECELPKNGFWFKPSLFTSVQANYKIATEEIFGPVLTTLTFRTPEEAVEIANNTEYGL
ncbi:aldehyde dehydrogenase family protein, partial [Acidimicrobiaceae bacterium]|nr:aldehyde dehydrogenase family protein [Acidimicrobiaceae bacterium]